MYVTGLSLTNFRGFEKADLSLSKITLITGSNCTGKSSLLYGILAPLQSEAFPFNLAANGKYVNLGDFKEMVFRNDSKRKIHIDITTAGKDDEDEQSLRTEWIFQKKWKMPKLNYMKVSSRFEKVEVFLDKTGKEYVLNLDYDPAKFKGESAEMAGVVRPLLLFEKIQEERIDEQEEKAGGREFDLLKPYRIKGRKFKSIEKLFEQIPFMGVLHHLTVLLDDVNYISPSGIRPERTYYHSTSQALKVDKEGGNYIEQIYEWERQNDKAFEKLKSVLRDLNLAYQLRARELSSGQYEVRVKAHSSKNWTLLADAGCGLNGILPILVADLQLRDNSTLFLSYPEKYLYPTSQAALGDYFIKQAQTRGKRYVLETNSAAVLNRVRAAVTSGGCKPGDISVYYLERHSEAAEIHQISFQKDGKLENAPKSFIKDFAIA